VTGANNAVDERPPQTRTALLEHAHRGIDALLLLETQRLPPHPELICELDIPRPSTIPRSAYAFKRM